jgi:DNA-binding protein HU-beta
VNKRELMAEIAFRASSSTTDVLAHLEAFEEIVTETLSEGEEVHVPGFGKFCIREREGRRVAVFHAGKKLREAI